eukprot:1862297-Pyramimonas_sp.AAC.1
MYIGVCGRGSEHKLFGNKLYSLPRLCLEGFLLGVLQRPGSGLRPGRFPQDPPRGSTRIPRFA